MTEYSEVSSYSYYTVICGLFSNRKQPEKLYKYYKHLEGTGELLR